MVQLRTAAVTHLLGDLGLLWEKNCLDVWQNTTLGDGDTREEFVQFLVVADSQLQVTWDDSCLLVVSGGIACEFKYFSSQVFQDGGEVHWSTSTYTFSVVSFA